MTLPKLSPERLPSQIGPQASPFSPPKTATKSERGSQARLRGYAMEAEALRVLQSAQSTWQLLARNYRAPGRWPGEIDLIFEAPQRGGTLLVFVEVRTRLNARESGLESVGFKKRRQVERVAASFMRDYASKRARAPCARGARFDVMSFDGTRWTHVPGAW